MIQRRLGFLLGLIAIVVAGVAIYRGLCFKQRKTIALIAASTISQHEAVTNCLKTLVDQQGGVDLRPFLLDNPTDQQKVSVICEEALGQRANCIVVVGRTLTQSVVNLARKRNIETPIIFIGAQAPVELGIVADLQHPGGNVTGVFIAPLYEDIPARLVCAAFPSVKRILVPFYAPQDASREIEGKVKAMCAYFEKNGVEALPQGVDSLFEGAKICQARVSAYDMLMTIEGDGLNDSQMVAFARLTKKFDVGYFASIGEAIEEGALCSYAMSVRYLAEAAFSQALEILYKGMHPSMMPVAQLTSSRDFIVNQERARELGIELDLNSLEKAIESDPVLACVRGRVRVI